MGALVRTQRLTRGRGAKAFSLAELLVVCGIIALLVSVILPALQLARNQARRVVCSAQLSQLGKALLEIHEDHRGFYPLWDDGAPVRYTWVDVLIQGRYFTNPAGAYCPDDQRPDALNQARGAAQRAYYPANKNINGMDYSYGISGLLAAGSWAWQPGANYDGRRRQFVDPDSDASRRLLASDGNWSSIYNFSGQALRSGIWNDPTWYANTIAYRHTHAANILLQSGAVVPVTYQVAAAVPVDTTEYYLWYPGEPIDVGPDNQWHDNFFPYIAAPNYQSNPPGKTIPNEVVPYWYTKRQLWTWPQK
jgi:type II secretory pathway pseudopilin PulG